MNSIVLSGNLANDVTLTTAGTTKVAHFRLAVQRAFAKKGEKPATDFFNITAFGATAEFAANYLSKGRGCEITGSLQTDQYEKDGRTIYTTFVKADRIGFTPSSGNGTRNTSSGAAAPVSAPGAAPAAAPAPDPTDPFGGFGDPFGGSADPFGGDLPFGG